MEGGVDASNFTTGKVRSSYFNGTIDEVMVFNRALGTGEISALSENSVSLAPAEKVFITHPCSGRCDYRLVMGRSITPATVTC